MPIIFRTEDETKWGAGKGSNLTPGEVDENIWELLGRIAALEDSPPTAISIDHFEVVGALMYVHMSNLAVLGPYTLPVSAWAMRDAWQPLTPYAAMDVVTNGGSVYLVNRAHTSAAAFDPYATGGSGLDYYSLLLKNPDPIFDFAFFYPDQIRAAGATLFQSSIMRRVKLPADLAESVAYLRVAPTSDLSLPIYRNSTLIGSIDFIASLGGDIDGGQPGSFTFAAETYLEPGERFTIIEPTGTEDATARGLSVTIVASIP